MSCRIAHLTDRGVIEVAGDNVDAFLNGLVTNDTARARKDVAVHAALLTPQGKILFDFMVVAHGDGFLLEADATLAGDLVKRLTFYKLRAPVTIADVSERYDVSVLWDGEAALAEDVIAYADPRLAELGTRLLTPKGTALESVGCAVVREDVYHAHRIALGVPQGGVDYAYGEAFPHEADFDQLNGVDFRKGCFVGQEVVSRMQHRGTARKRVLPVQADAGSGVLPERGTAVTAGRTVVGQIGSSVGPSGLAMIRLDRAEKARIEGRELAAGDVPISVVRPDWATFTIPGGEAAGHGGDDDESAA